MKVALVHYWLVGMRGGEKVLELLCELYPDADIFTLVCDKEQISPTIKRHRITTSFIQRLPFGLKKYQHYLPLMPLAVEQFDLRGYDLVISSDASVAKGVITDAETCHLCYCHSPVRYAWDLYQDYKNGSGLSFLMRGAMALIMHYIRLWDVAAAARVDHFIANSENVRRRIAKTYRRDATVVHPPVDFSRFSSVTPPLGDDYYLMLGQLIPYKRADIAVEAFNASGRRLKIVGRGSEEKRLRAMAKNNIEFLGFLSDEEIAKLYAGCRAFIFPGLEDFGITPLEANAAGRPVIAYGKGGALETVVGTHYSGEGVDPASHTGVFFGEQTAEDLNRAIDFFERKAQVFSAQVCKDNAARFERGVIRRELEQAIMGALVGSKNDKSR